MNYPKLTAIAAPCSRLYASMIARILLREFPLDKREFAIDCAINIEKSVRDYLAANGATCDFLNPIYTSVYGTHMAKILANMDMKSSVGSNYIIEALLSGAILPENIGKMSSSELSPNSTLDEREFIKIQRNQSVTLSYSDQYVCVKCKKRRITIEHKQHSALDEMSDVVKRCLDCGYVFKYA
jgi:DNA-directed RNA polymerase subunit M/transcription elongation factor TFIIS